MDAWLTYITDYQPDVGTLIAVVLTAATMWLVYRALYRDRMDDTAMLLGELRKEVDDLRTRVDRAEAAEERCIERLNEVKLEVAQIKRERDEERDAHDMELEEYERRLDELRAEVARLREEYSEPSEVA